MRDVSVTVFETAWGWVGVAASPRGLAEVRFPQVVEGVAWREIRERWPEAEVMPSDDLGSLKDRLLRFYSGEPVSFVNDVSALDYPPGRPFYRLVWQAVASIPYGETRTYGQVAVLAGSPRAARAVGTAMASNRWPIIVPCHRVIGSAGQLTGFGGGLGLKARLLALESKTADIRK